MSSTKHIPFATIDEALGNIRHGKMVVGDHEDRANHGDLMMLTR